MQFHYTVMFDTESDTWSVEFDPSAYYPDGNIYDKSNDIGHGWFFPEEGSFDESLDHKCWQMLHSLVTIWPSPLVNGEL